MSQDTSPTPAPASEPAPNPLADASPAEIEAAIDESREGADYGEDWLGEDAKVGDAVIDDELADWGPDPVEGEEAPAVEASPEPATDAPATTADAPATTTSEAAPPPSDRHLELLEKQTALIERLLTPQATAKPEPEAPQEVDYVQRYDQDPDFRETVLRALRLDDASMEALPEGARMPEAHRHMRAVEVLELRQVRRDNAKLAAELQAFRAGLEAEKVSAQRQSVESQAKSTLKAKLASDYGDLSAPRFSKAIAAIESMVLAGIKQGYAADAVLATALDTFGPLLPAKAAPKPAAAKAPVPVHSKVDQRVAAPSRATHRSKDFGKDISLRRLEARMAGGRS